MPHTEEFILTVACPDQIGIVYHVSQFLYDRECNVLDSSQYGDDSTGLFFLRVHFNTPENFHNQVQRLHDEFEPIQLKFDMKVQFHALTVKPQVLLMVSKLGHCLNDLLFRWKSGLLPCHIQAIVSNHSTHENLAVSYGVPFYYLPIIQAEKTKQEHQVRALIQQIGIDLIVLARYMQVLSPTFCAEFSGRIINIHHSFLPSFKGAKPYQQAYDRGVKLIGATAHYVTSELDEGPIIEQDVARVDHSFSPEALTTQGQDTECQVLARSVKWHCEHRVILNGSKTVVFK